MIKVSLSLTGLAQDYEKLHPSISYFSYREVVINNLRVLNEVAGGGVEARAVGEAFHPQDLNNSEIIRD